MTGACWASSPGWTGTRTGRDDGSRGSLRREPCPGLRLLFFRPGSHAPSAHTQFLDPRRSRARSIPIPCPLALCHFGERCRSRARPCYIPGHLPLCRQRRTRRKLEPGPEPRLCFPSFSFAGFADSAACSAHYGALTTLDFGLFAGSTPPPFYLDLPFPCTWTTFSRFFTTRRLFSLTHLELGCLLATRHLIVPSHHKQQQPQHV